jgi:ribosomal protein S6--L-glutamate ligase
MKAMPGRFRANIHLGGTASVDKQLKKRTHCIKAAKAMDLKVAGVDIIHLQRTFVAGVNPQDLRGIGRA